jgi:hypothetical protein
VPIAFPDQTGAVSKHWGLLSSIDPSGEVWIQTAQAITCDPADSTCTDAGVTVQNVPLAVRFKVAGASADGGNMIYTSFHNIAQPTNDVSAILKYIVLNL